MNSVIVVGNGLAAMNFIRQLKNDVTLYWVSEAPVEETNSYLAKGGIAISVPEPDKIRTHIEDTLVAGAGICNAQVVEEIISSGPFLYQKLIRAGLEFDPEPGKEGGHSESRIRHIADETGRYLSEFFNREVGHRKGIHRFPESILLDLILENGVVTGVEIANRKAGYIQRIYAGMVVLATGGMGHLYSQTTNSDHCNGEGISIAARAGAEVSNLEYIQFHPTKMFLPGKLANVLVTEAFRGAGAVVTDASGREIMEGVHPMGCLAPRDIVARTLYKTMQENNLSHLYLDFKQVPEADFKKNFPYLYQVSHGMGFIESGRIPVVPAAHYQCGGVKAGLNGKTTVPGLYVLGEIACTGLHGANRLASNSLLELFYMSDALAEFTALSANDSPGKVEVVRSYKKSRPGLEDEFMDELREIMWNHFGIIRYAQKMETGLFEINGMLEDCKDKFNHTGNPIYRQLQNRLETARAVAMAALSDTTSRGCHYVEYSNGNSESEWSREQYLTPELQTEMD